MKNIYILFLTILFSVVSFAQVPEKISFQAVIRDANSNIMPNSEVSIRISILKDFNTGTPVYTERHQPITNTNGLVSLKIGEGSIEMGDFSSINWSEADYYLKTETDVNGGTNYDIVGVSQLLSVPFALHAKTVESYDEKVTTLTNNNDGTFDYINEEDTTTTINLISSDTGNTVTVGSDGGVFSISAPETVTTLTNNDGTIDYTNEAGDLTSINLISSDSGNSITVGSDGGSLLNVSGLSEVEPWRNTDTTPATSTSTNMNYMNGNIGIGNNNPSEKLDVNGNIKTTGTLQLGTITGISIGSPCGSDEAGKIIFNGANFCACNGTNWKKVD